MTGCRTLSSRQVFSSGRSFPSSATLSAYDADRAVDSTIGPVGRPPSPWLEHAYEFCADGRWHRREDVLKAMVPVVPPNFAYKRGVQQSPDPSRLTDRELIRRGARHISINALQSCSVLTMKNRGGDWFVRLANSPRRPLPVVMEPSTKRQASHVLMPIEDYRELGVEIEQVQYLRDPGDRHASH